MGIFVRNAKDTVGIAIDEVALFDSGVIEIQVDNYAIVPIGELHRQVLPPDLAHHISGRQVKCKTLIGREDDGDIDVRIVGNEVAVSYETEQRACVYPSLEVSGVVEPPNQSRPTLARRYGGERRASQLVNNMATLHTSNTSHRG